MKKRITHIAILSLSVLIGSTTLSFSNTLTPDKLDDILSVKYDGKPNSRTFIENNKKKKSYKKPVIRIFNADNCPTFEAYHSKSKIKRQKMLEKKAKRN